MKGSQKVLDTLDKLLGLELTASHTYLLQGRQLATWGYEKLSKKQGEEAAEELGHATRLIDRITWLGGTPGMARLAVPQVKTVPDLFRTDLELETKVRDAYLAAMPAVLDAGDPETWRILGEVLRDTEGHVNWLESQLRLMDDIGEPDFLATWV